MNRKLRLAAIFVLLTAGAWAQTPTPETTPGGAVPAPSAGIPWKTWFEKNTVVADKGDYVHFFWNAQDVKDQLEAPNRTSLLAQAARELAKNLTPAGAQADLMKVDIVYVAERDDYGMPKWDSLSRVAHLEFSRAKLLAVPVKVFLGKEETIKKQFTDFEILE